MPVSESTNADDDEDDRDDAGQALELFLGAEPAAIGALDAAADRAGEALLFRRLDRQQDDQQKRRDDEDAGEAVRQPRQVLGDPRLRLDRGRGSGAFGGTAACGNTVAAADGTAFDAARRANRSGLKIRLFLIEQALAACSLRPQAPARLPTQYRLPCPKSESARPAGRSARIVPIKNRRVWRDLARILSTIFNPFLTALALFVILAHIGAKDTLDFWRLLFISTFFTSIGPMLYVFWLYATDRISDLDMSVRDRAGDGLHRLRHLLRLRRRCALDRARPAA